MAVYSSTNTIIMLSLKDLTQTLSEKSSNVKAFVESRNVSP